MTNIVLYGIGNANDSYRVMRYYRFFEQEATIRDLIVNAMMMAEYYPSIDKVYAIDNISSLYWDYIRTTKHPSIENNVVFKSILEDMGLLVYQR